MDPFRKCIGSFTGVGSHGINNAGMRENLYAFSR